MLTEFVAVRDGISLALDRWDPPGYPARPAPAGDGPARAPWFLLVHGLASNARLWDGVAAELVAAGHPVAAVDLRGHGRSSKPDTGYDVPTVADDLATLIAAIDLGRPIVVGQSWGGNVAVELAARRPSIVDAVACVDGGWIDLQTAFPDWEACRRALAPPRIAGRRFGEVEAWIRTAHADWPETGIRGTLANLELRDDGTVAPWLTFDRHILVLRGLWEHRPAERYPTIDVPVLLIPAERAAGDDPSKRAAVDAASAALPRSTVRWFVGDHDIHAQFPNEVAGVLASMTPAGEP
ncbi:MAG: alpha/beta hydrolase [Candidatus Limnocylindrales bacterium]